MPSVAFYVSGHGFGHAARQIEIVNALGPRLPRGWTILIRTAAPAWLLGRTLRTPVAVLGGECDTGIAQIDSLRLNADDTARAAAAFYATFDARTDAEAALLRDHDARLIVSDAPPLACAASAAIGVPAIVISNFTWDWIYEAYEEFEAAAPGVLPIVRGAYARATAGWQLPMHGGFATVPNLTALPFVARHASRHRTEVLERLRLPSGRPLALSSFGGYGLDALDPASLDCRDRWTVVVTGRTPPAALPHGVAFVDEASIYDAGLRYEDLVAAVDVVVTKPGYGIISECVANDTAILYTSRGRFAEYDVLVREMPRVVRCQYLDQASLLAGRWRTPLDTLLAAPPPPEHPATDGADTAARRVLERLAG